MPKDEDLTQGEIEDMIQGAFELSKKREAFCKAVKPCPKCNTNQVQLIDWTDVAKWKCRHCKHRWEGE